MFDIGWQEIFVIGVVAIVAVGPKDLPRVLRAAGKWARKGRSVMREFHGIIDDIMDEAELKELKEDAKRAADLNFKEEAEKTIDPKGKLASAFDPDDKERDLDARIAKTIKDAPKPDNQPQNASPEKPL